MQRYAAETRVQEGLNVIVLTDRSSDSEARLLPDAGNNLFLFSSAGQEIIKTPISLHRLREDRSAATRYGTPILFPPNRIQDGMFTFKGRNYRFPLTEPPEYHLHGELVSRAWEVVAYGSSEEEGAWVTSRLQYADHPDILAYYPHPLTFAITYRLLDGKLQMDSTIKNEGTDEAPFFYGLHPYFSIPAALENSTTLHIPAVEEWPATDKAFVTGMPSDTALSQAMRSGFPLASYPKLGCSMLTLDPESDAICRFKLPAYSIAYQVDKQFPFVLLFSPSWNESFSIEPYTYLTDAFNLPYSPDLTGAQGIVAGEERCLRTSLWVE
ncbi:aldose 1-epimerase [Paenibacillus rhizovicinus]|uniref:Aldose 1-epimerase n=1 Tax=Paenibacillus rhizovicinus TaxID=2704463 RepID=A0A6C0P5V0_9BACL|nr:aldose 1-epimerase [Paenibacillus rhizovicinus]QHW33731.1 aldose 1-epimerase [Paenibacillus rhizovicinus]